MRRAPAGALERRRAISAAPSGARIQCSRRTGGLHHRLISNVPSGHEVVAVHGIGGLGHLGVQYARQMGFQTVALGRGKDKEPLAKKLGAHHYIDSDVVDPVKELQKLGGARVILATAPSAKAISSVVEGLAVDGNLLIPAAPNDPLTVGVLPLIMGRRQ